MAVLRTNNEQNLKNYGPNRQIVIGADEWASPEDSKRIDETVWIERYKYEAELITNVIKKNNYTKILELGAGPGVMGQFVMDDVPDLTYHFIDNAEACKIHSKRNHKGTFFVKDLFNSFDISELDDDYDLIIANDFLEHIANPSDVLYKSSLITKDTATFFISLPNWRMGHVFLLRGLFDWDNWLYTMMIHGWNCINVSSGPLKCPPTPKLSSEDGLPDALINSWNWYMIYDKRS